MKNFRKYPLDSLAFSCPTCYHSCMTPAERKLIGLNLRPGDIVGFSGTGIVSDAINIGTYGCPRWGLAHVGIVSEYNHERYLFESTTTNGDKDCDILHRPVSGVQAHLLSDIVTRPGKVWLYRPRKPLDTFEKRRLRVSLLAQLGTPYDYAGALQSRGFLLNFLRSLLRKQEISELFCSELVAFVLSQAGVYHTSNASFQSPNLLARSIVKDGVYYDRTRIK